MSERVCVFCGASSSIAPRFLELASRTGGMLARAGVAVVFGGGAHGMMGALASGALDAGGEVVGIWPAFLSDVEPPHGGVADMRVVGSMHERKAAMYAESDAFFVLPGGFGTLDEAMEIITWRKLSLHAKPIVFVGDAGFWAPLRTTFATMREGGFFGDADARLASFADTPEAALALVRAARARGAAARG